MAAEFVGAGWAFPMRVNASGGIALVSGDEELAESMRLILGTAYGDRPMRPEFGCAIHDFVFAPADATTAGRIAFEVTRSLERWEPRVEVVDVEVEAGGDGSTLFVDITYAVKGTNDRRNLVFPFYVIPAEAPDDQPADVARSF